MRIGVLWGIQCIYILQTFISICTLLLSHFIVLERGGGGQMGQTDHCISFVNNVYYTTTAFSLHALTCVQQVLVRELEQCVATVTT